MGGRKMVLLVSSLLLLLCSGCNTTKYLGQDEYFLKKNEIILKPTEKIENKPNFTYELSTLYRQKPNGKFFFFVPREWFYYKTQPPKDQKAIRRWIRKAIAQPPVIYDDEIATTTADELERYLNDKGYYNAEVFHERELSGKHKVKVKYYVYPNAKARIDTITFQSPDQSVDSILQSIKDQTLLTKEEGLTKSIVEAERLRITNHLRNNGYARFLPNYVPRPDGDTTNGPQQTKVFMDVSLPYQDSLHRVYTTGEITVLPEYFITVPEDSLIEMRYGVFRFLVPDSNHLVKPEVIMKAIKLWPGSVYSQRDYDQTTQRLNSFSIYRFVRIEEVPDTINPYKINFRIELTPKKLNEFGFDFELDYTNRPSTPGAGNLIGIGASPSLRNRNFFGGAEVFISNLRAGVEINPEDNRFWNTIDLGTQMDIYLPRFKDYFGFWKLISKLSFKKEDDQDFSSYYNTLREQGATRIRTSYDYVLLLDFYRYNLLTASYGYDYLKDQNNRYILNNLAIDYFDPTTQPAFDSILNVNPFLDRSFGDQLFVSLLFREFNYVFNGPTSRLGRNKYLSLNVETAGAEIWLANGIYNGFASQADTFRIGDTEFSQYLRLEGDLRFIRNYSGRNALATRLSMGIARPFGSSQDVPYVKQFFIGGPNSIRAWPARSLGPGAFIDSLTLDLNNPLLFYQAGDFKLEFNLEYRFNIFWRLNGAVFLDAGNTWTVREDRSRPESQFVIRPTEVTDLEGNTFIVDPFYKQIAIGTGLGFRFDFTYFIFRLDLGLRLKYPYKWREDRYWVKPDEWLDDINFNFSLGYPF